MISKCIRRVRDAKSRDRRGTTIVEFAIILPAFGLMMMGILEFGHIYMVYNTMTAATKRAARYGSVSGVSNTEVETRVRDILGAAIDVSHANILVKDASIFDSESLDTETMDYDELDDIQLDELERRQLFLIFVSVPYSDVAILPPFWAGNLVLSAQAVMRHE